jgi:polysaccharide export outer membrane protein
MTNGFAGLAFTSKTGDWNVSSPNTGQGWPRLLRSRPSGSQSPHMDTDLSEKLRMFSHIHRQARLAANLHEIVQEEDPMPVLKRNLRIVVTLFCIAAAAASAQSAPPVAAGTRPDLSNATDTGSSQFALGVADVIHVNVWKNTDLSQTVILGPDGFVTLPLIGEMHVAGMTANQLGRLIESKLKAYVVNPQVTVSMVEIHSRRVFVLGQVTKPGSFPLIAPITVLQLIAEAGGLNTYANRKGIFILRIDNDTTRKIPFNYSDVIKGNAKQNLNLQPGDTVVVP